MKIKKKWYKTEGIEFRERYEESINERVFDEFHIRSACRLFPIKPDDFNYGIHGEEIREAEAGKFVLAISPDPQEKRIIFAREDYSDDIYQHFRIRTPNREELEKLIFKSSGFRGEWGRFHEGIPIPEEFIQIGGAYYGVPNNNQIYLDGSSMAFGDANREIIERCFEESNFTLEFGSLIGTQKVSRFFYGKLLRG